MKVFAVLVLVALFVHSEQQEQSADDAARIQRIKKYRDECIVLTNVDPALIDRADRGDFAQDNKLYCFSKCFYQKAGFVSEDGELLLDVIKEKIPKEANREKALDIIDKCKELKGADSCETVFLVHKCYYEDAYLGDKKE